MLYPSIDKLLNQVGSKYLLVNIVTKRAKEMTDNNYYQLDSKEYNSKREIGKALEEISKQMIDIYEQKNE